MGMAPPRGNTRELGGSCFRATGTLGCLMGVDQSSLLDGAEVVKSFEVWGLWGRMREKLAWKKQTTGCMVGFWYFFVRFSCLVALVKTTSYYSGHISDIRTKSKANLAI